MVWIEVLRGAFDSDNCDGGCNHFLGLSYRSERCLPEHDHQGSVPSASHHIINIHIITTVDSVEYSAIDMLFVDQSVFNSSPHVIARCLTTGPDRLGSLFLTKHGATSVQNIDRVSIHTLCKRFITRASSHAMKEVSVGHVRVFRCLLLKSRDGKISDADWTWYRQIAGRLIRHIIHLGL